MIPLWLTESLKVKIREDDRIRALKNEIRTKQDDHALSTVNEVAYGIEQKRKRKSNTAGSSTTSSAAGTKVQKTLQETSGVAISTQLSAAICELVYAHGCSDSMASSKQMRRVIKLARDAPSSYAPPNVNAVSGEFLDENAALRLKRAIELVQSFAGIFGTSMLSDGATVHGCPLINFLAGIPGGMPPLLKLTDASDHLATGGGKDALWLAHEMIPLAEEIGARNVYLWIFDGASNEQGAGIMLETKYHGQPFFMDLSMCYRWKSGQYVKSQKSNSWLMAIAQYTHGSRTITSRRQSTPNMQDSSTEAGNYP